MAIIVKDLYYMRYRVCGISRGTLGHGDSVVANEM